MRKHRVLSFMVLFGSTLSLPACASIVTGGHQSITFNSNPEGATVTVDGNAMGKTPLTTLLKKKPGQTLEFNMEGYRPFLTQLQTQTNPWFFGNIIIGGLVGSSTDFFSGAIYEYSPNRYLVTLQPVDLYPLSSQRQPPGDTGSPGPPAAASVSTHSMETFTSLTDSQKRKDYIVKNYDGLVNDLKNGPAAKPGEYLAALLSLLDVKPNMEYDAIKRMRAMSVTYPDAIEFADHVIEEFGG